MVARSHPAVVPPVRRPFHVVVGPASRRRRVGQWVAFALITFALFFLLVVSRIALDQSAFVSQDLEHRISAEEARYWELRLRVAELQAPERISALATEMGMVYPTELRPVEVPGLGTPGPGVEERWVSLKTLLSAQP
jgi:hypothetical protein